ncbi:hypothetical protein C8A01DRAFT_31976 [Parachaetomium inaequale]|uniref:Uncharacterized protein n=1 Tax=Parachaetomium inaequale TaxID=2588326 RepID=A0AAN6PN46_9PEZI|nr:hypothetical protein C8A01DRAFT_31976 [Parachaetomium inaequale]
METPSDSDSEQRAQGHRARKNAEDKLETMKNQSFAVQRYVDWHKAHDPQLADTEGSQAILDELCRSSQPKASEHIIWRNCKWVCKAIQKWMGKYENWEAATAGQNGTPMPYLVLPAQLRALRYLEPNGSPLPGRLRELLHGVDLEWYADGMEPSTWWKGAQLGDPAWRQNHMRPPPRYNGGQVKADELLALMKTAFSEEPDPAADPNHPATNNEPPRASKTSVDLNSATFLKQKNSALPDKPVDIQEQPRANLEAPGREASPVRAQLHSNRLDEDEGGGAILSNGPEKNTAPAALQHDVTVLRRSSRGGIDLRNIRAWKRDAGPGISPVSERTRRAISRGQESQGSSSSNVQELDFEVPSVNANPQPQTGTDVDSAAERAAGPDAPASPEPAPKLPDFGRALADQLGAMWTTMSKEFDEDLTSQLATIKGQMNGASEREETLRQEFEQRLRSMEAVIDKKVSEAKCDVEEKLKRVFEQRLADIDAAIDKKVSEARHSMEEKLKRELDVRDKKIQALQEGKNKKIQGLREENDRLKAEFDALKEGMVEIDDVVGKMRDRYL